MDFAVLCIRLEQNNGIVTVVDFNTEKKVQLKGCFTIGKYSKNTSCPILCLPLKGSAHSSVKQYAKNGCPLLTSPPFIYWFSPYVTEHLKLTL